MNIFSKDKLLQGIITIKIIYGFKGYFLLLKSSRINVCVKIVYYIFTRGPFGLRVLSSPVSVCVSNCVSVNFCLSGR